MKTSIKLGILAAACTLATAADVLAVCNQSAASQADIDLWNVHGCWTDFFLWQYKAYDCRSGDWSGRGWENACNNRLEYPKHWNAAYLVTYGLVDDENRAFHGTIDYRGTAEATGNSYHTSLYHMPTDRTDVFGAFQWQPIGSNQLLTACPLYNATVQNANPASRAGDFMHEGWHGWMAKYGWYNGSVGGHRPGPQGACTINGCDYFYWHGLNAYEFGAMYQTDGTASRFHSPNQVQVEYLCDVADVSKSWVPASVRQGARTDANFRSVTRFINGPGYSCGSPRPW